MRGANTSIWPRLQASLRLFSTLNEAQVLRYREFGEPSEVLKIETDKLEEISGDKIKIKMLAAPINPADINMVEGRYGLLPDLPAVGGNEGVAVVDDVGPEVKSVKIGDWVLPSQAGLGTWRTAAVVNESHVTSCPQGLSHIEASVLAVNPCTAFRLLNNYNKIEKGDTVIMNAATSMVAASAIQIAKARDAASVAIVLDSPPGGLEATKTRLYDLGATVVATESEAKEKSFKSVLKDLKPASLALNMVGGDSASTLARYLGNGGCMVTFGGLSKQPVTIPTPYFIFKDIRLAGFWNTRVNKEEPKESRDKMLAEIANMVKTGSLKVDVTGMPFHHGEAINTINAANDPVKTSKIVFDFEL
eukprot:TRINITY_DN32896_c0_g1_i1.p1 TRINITY_DN32896_c0_g1~~TRINITY_DN32896_c0_g1_i1.p1  ORF type:complete len:376 (-),score=76.38 TRINITY_DN32896_c0_g1_i1:12-1094(-)